MAKIFGFKIIGESIFEGREGYGVYAPVYWNNKKIGIYTDYADGSDSFIDWDKDVSNDLKKELLNISEKYIKEHPEVVFGQDQYRCLIALFENLLELYTYEEAFVKFRKKSPNGVMVVLKYYPATCDNIEDFNIRGEDKELFFTEWKESFLRFIKRDYDNPEQIIVYKSLNDFTIV